MALHFSEEEFERRKQLVISEMSKRNLDALLIFAQESMYWLTGYDTFGYCFFQCMVLTKCGDITLLTRSADLRQAHHTSNVTDIRVWIDRAKANPANDLRKLLDEYDLLGSNIGVEYDTHGLTAANGRLIDEMLNSFAEASDQSDLIPALRVVKSDEELTYVRKAGVLADAAFNAALDVTHARADEGKILAAMHNAIFEAGGDYPGNEFILGSGKDALLCRYKAGRRVLDEQDQITFEWAGTFRHYHAAAMRTVPIGKPSKRHEELFEAAKEALIACRNVLKPGHTFGDVFSAHAKVMESRKLSSHRLNACGYSLGARFSPSWMDTPMFYAENPVPIVPNMVLFTHMILMDSETETAMTLGQSYITTEGEPECLSNLPLELITR